MEKISKKSLDLYLKENNSEAKCIFIDPRELIFEENVKMNCFYCGKYNNNWMCPPNIPNINFEKMVQEFDKGAFIYLDYNIKNKDEYEKIRNESSIILHKLLLNLEKWMWGKNKPNVISFIGGSCKLCKGGCGKEGCNNPYMSRSPLEAIGVNVIKSAKKYGINIRFPAGQNLTRIGLLLWQEEDKL